MYNYCKCISYSWKLSRAKTFANRQKYSISQRKFPWIATRKVAILRNLRKIFHPRKFQAIQYNLYVCGPDTQPIVRTTHPFKVRVQVHSESHPDESRESGGEHTHLQLERESHHHVSLAVQVDEDDALRLVDRFAQFLNLAQHVLGLFGKQV